MPLVTNGVTIPFDAKSDNLIRESQKVIDELERVKEAVKTNGKIIEDQAKREEAARKSATMSWTDFRSMYQTVLDVVRVGQQVWEETGQKYVDNAVLVGNMARAMGTTTEEASRLKEVADDVGISTDSLKTSMKLALKDGFEPNIEGLARMSDEYLKLAPGTERMQYLMDRFGKSGEEMGKILEKGGASIRTMSDAIDENLIVTEEGYQQAEQYRKSVDNLKDSWDGFTMNLGKSAVPALNDVLTAMNKNIEAGDQWKGALYAIPIYGQIRAYKDLKAAHEENTQATKDGTDAANNATGAFESEAERTKRLADEAKAAEQAIKDLTKANQDELKTLGDLTKTVDDYNSKQEDLKTKHDELMAKKQQLLIDGWGAESDKIKEVTKDLTENEQAQLDNAAEFELASRRRILARAEELLSIDGLTTEEKDGLIERGLAMGVYTQEAAQRMRDEERAAQSLASSLNSIPSAVSTTVTTTYMTNYVNSGPNYNPYASQSRPATKHASGGMFEIPQSYGNEGFRMGGGDTASGGEKLAIAPKGQDFFDYKRSARETAKYLAYELRKGGG